MHRLDLKQGNGTAAPQKAAAPSILSARGRENAYPRLFHIRKGWPEDIHWDFAVKPAFASRPQNEALMNTQLAAAVATARTIAQVDEISRITWKAWSEGHVTDVDASRLQGIVEQRKTSLRASISSQLERPPATARRHPARARDRRKSITRRRRTAMAGVLPGALAVHFTMGEVAVLSAIGHEVRRRKDHRSELSIAAIGELSGCCRTLVQTAIRQAQKLGLIAIKERPRPGQPSLTNIIVVRSLQWRAWLRLGGRAHGNGHKKITREKGAGRSSFVLINGEERHSHPTAGAGP